MASKKQRRRRQKDRRHDWEYVYVDEEGQEVEVAEEEPPGKARKAGARTPAKGSRASGRAGRVVDPPSWRRVAKRALIFAPLMLVVVYLLQGKHHDYLQAIAQTVILLAFFVPFSYFMDTLMYRSYRKRTGGGAAKQR